MKRYNAVNQKWILLGILIPILLFYLSYGVVYAYFTATAKNAEGTITTGILKVKFSDTTDVSVSEQSINDVSILPGDTVVISGSVVNDGTVPMYALLVIQVNVEESRIGDEITYTTVETSYYNAAGTQLVYNATDDIYTTGSTLIAKSGTSGFSISYTFEGESYGSEYQGKAVQILVMARAIQTVNLDDGVTTNDGGAQDATNILLGKNKATD